MPELKYWKNGGPRDVWVSVHDKVEALIEAHRLRPIRAELLPEHMLMVAPVAPAEVEMAGVTPRRAENIVLKRQGFAGGMRVPHLHFSGRVYLLNQEQWKEFSNVMLDSFREKLATVNAVSFDQLMELSEAVNALP